MQSRSSERDVGFGLQIVMVLRFLAMILILAILTYSSYFIFTNINIIIVIIIGHKIMLASAWLLIVKSFIVYTNGIDNRKPTYPLKEEFFVFVIVVENTYPECNLYVSLPV